MSIWTSDSAVAAYIGGAAAVIGAAFSHFGSKILRQESVAGKNLRAQLDGWKDFSRVLTERNAYLEKIIVEHRKEIDECRRLVDECEERSDRQKRRIANLERRLGIEPKED